MPQLLWVVAVQSAHSSCLSLLLWSGGPLIQLAGVSPPPAAQVSVLQVVSWYLTVCSCGSAGFLLVVDAFNPLFFKKFLFDVAASWDRMYPCLVFKGCWACEVGVRWSTGFPKQDKKAFCYYLFFLLAPLNVLLCSIQSPPVYLLGDCGAFGVLQSQKMRMVFTDSPRVPLVLRSVFPFALPGPSEVGWLESKHPFTRGVSLSSVTKPQGFQPPLSFSLLSCLFICSTLYRGTYYNAFVSFRTGFMKL